MNATESPDAFVVVQQALAAGRVLALDYEDAAGRRSRRRVEPAGVVEAEGAWYLLGWCRLRQEARCFRLDRIARALDTGEPSAQPRLDDAVLAAPSAPRLRVGQRVAGGSHA